MRLRLPTILLALAACRGAEHGTVPATHDSASTTVVAALDTTPPAGPLGASIRRGQALLEHTPDSLPAFVGGNLRCTSCHLDSGRRPNAAPLTAVMARFPKYMDRADAVVPVEDRVNYCFTRSLAGRAIPSGTREMVDIVAYLAFLSRGAPPGGHIKGEGMARMTVLPSDSGRGALLFASNCARCHGADGAGMAAVPALWGPRSYSIGASMARVERAASFIQHNMPFDKPGSLTNQQAFDLARFVDSHARPDSPGKEQDWPAGDAPADVPYDTKGHKAGMRVPLLPRRFADGALVPVPKSVK